MDKRKTLILSFLGFTTLISGCNITKVFEEEKKEPVVQRDVVKEKISDATISINRTLSELAEIEQNKRWQSQQIIHYNKINPLASNVERLVYKGNIETILSTLSKEANISFKVVGKPVSEVVVYLDHRQVNLQTVFQDIGTQVDNRADLKYRDFGAYKKLELIYVAR